MIDINKLSFAYKKQAPLFEGLSLSEAEGQIVGLLGKNGAGKTTLLQLISGLLSPDSGEVLVNGFKSVKREAAFLESLYFVPEEFTMPSVKMWDFIEAFIPFYPRFDKQLLIDLIEKFELDQQKNLAKMSHGQKKKFRIAFALATRCQLIVLDEPTNGLDIPSKTIFRQLVAGSLQDDQTVLISTHQVKDVETLIDKIILVDNGQVVFNQSILDISEKYDFKIVSSLPDDALYSELNPMGYKIVSHSNGESSEVDIELLFNAISKGITFN